MTYRNADTTPTTGDAWACRQAAGRVDEARRDLRIAIGLLTGRPLPQELRDELDRQVGSLERLTDNLRRLAAALERVGTNTAGAGAALAARAEAIALGHRDHLETRLPYADD